MAAGPLGAWTKSSCPSFWSRLQMVVNTGVDVEQDLLQNRKVTILKQGGAWGLCSVICGL